MKYSPKEMKQSLEAQQFNFKKKFGQNFIVDENIINAIVKKAEIDENCLVIEIGPGAGSLTYKLAQVASQVLCYEIDTKLEDVLQHNLRDCQNVTVLYQDFLEADVKTDIKQYQYDTLYVVANLPYYITTPIIVKLIEDEIPVDKIVVMVQKEVGNRFKAQPGNKDYNSLSVYLNYYFDVTKLLDVSRNVFVPKPNVDSIVVQLKKKDQLFQLDHPPFFFQLVRDAFRQKRKTLRNNLKAYNLDVIEQVLSKYHMDLSVRAEQLSITIFVELANTLSRHSH